MGARVVALGLLVVGAAVCLAAPSGAGAISSTLTTGRSLYAYGVNFPDGASDELASSSGNYVLVVDNGMLTIQEFFARGGCTPWQTPQVGSASDTSRLTMQSDGNLVLYTSRGRNIWSSHTAGTGTGNRVVMQNNGNLVMYTAANKVVWSAGSGPGCLAPGMGIASGSRLVSRYDRNNASPITSLVMKRNGNLVVYYGGKIEWQSRTWIAGSTAKLMWNGNFVVRTPSFRVLWGSHTSRFGSTARLYVGNCGTVSIEGQPAKPSTNMSWSTPYVAIPGCL